jgi:hypothetical protein
MVQQQMAKYERTKYCVFYPGEDGELLIRENVGVDDLAKIYKEAEVQQNTNEVLAFNMDGISKPSDITTHPENTYNLIAINKGQLQVFENVGPEIEGLIQDADHYYIIDDIYAVSDAALRQLVK